MRPMISSSFEGFSEQDSPRWLARGLEARVDEEAHGASVATGTCVLGACNESLARVNHGLLRFVARQPGRASQFTSALSSPAAT